MDQIIDQIKRTDICIIDANENVRDASIKMRDMNYGCAIVLENDDLKGIFTERDILFKVVANDINPSNIFVKDIMIENVRTILGTENVFNALNLLKENNIRRLVVVDENNKVTGLTTIRDLMFTLISDLQEENTILGEFLIEEISHDLEDLRAIKDS